MKKINKAMEHVTGSDGNEEWVKKENLGAFHRDCQGVSALPIPKSEGATASGASEGGLPGLLQQLKKKAKDEKKANRLAKKLFKALVAEDGADYKFVLEELGGEDLTDVDARYADALEILED